MKASFESCIGATVTAMLAFASSESPAQAGVRFETLKSFPAPTYTQPSGPHVESVMWYYARTWEEVMETQSAAEMFDLIFNKRGFTYIIMPELKEEEFARFYEPEFQRMLKKEFAAGGYALYVPGVKPAGS
jgi:hypothetical protein